MPSPFPGMDPYLERPEVWPEFHNNLAAEIQGYLNQRIRPRYVARQVPIERPTSGSGMADPDYRSSPGRANSLARS